MVNPIKKLFIVFICLALVACARSPKVIDAESLSISIAEEIAELEIDASLKNIDLHTAIAIAVRNNRDLRISVMESALSQSQRDLQKFDMLPDIALKAGYSKFTELQPSTSVGVENDEAFGRKLISYYDEQDVLKRNQMAKSLNQDILNYKTVKPVLLSDILRDIGENLDLKGAIKILKIDIEGNSSFVVNDYDLMMKFDIIFAEILPQLKRQFSSMLYLEETKYLS